MITTPFCVSLWVFENLFILEHVRFQKTKSFKQIRTEEQSGEGRSHSTGRWSLCIQQPKRDAPALDTSSNGYSVRGEGARHLRHHKSRPALGWWSPCLDNGSLFQSQNIPQQKFSGNWEVSKEHFSHSKSAYDLSNCGLIKWNSLLTVLICLMFNVIIL